MNNSTNKRHTLESVVTGKTMAEAISDVQEDVLVAELSEELSSGSRKELNLSMLSTIAISIAFLILAMSFGKVIVHDSNDASVASGGKLRFHLGTQWICQWTPCEPNYQ